MVKGSKRNKQMFSDEELEIIRRLYPNTPNKVIATWMPHTSTSISNKAYAMGIKKTKEYIRSNCIQVALKQWENVEKSSRARRTCFHEGHTPWNKGQKLSAQHKAKLTGVFQKGNVPHNELPIGSIRDINSYNEIKYANHKWMSLSRYNWEQVHGPIPKDMCVFKLDGNKYNDDISNLCLVTRRDLAVLNRNHYKIPQELKEVQILINQIKDIVK